MDDFILTDGKGRPIEKPDREEFSDPVTYLRAVWAWQDKVHDIANKAFGDQFAKAMKGR